MFRLFCKIAIGVIVSMFLFPFSLKVLPSLNTKMMLAALGALLYCLNLVGRKGIVITVGLLGAACIACLFSYVCYYSTEYNHTSDYAYATYFVTFLVWMGGAYIVCKVIKWMHGEANLKYLTYYLAGVCAAQCFLAMVIDSVAPVKHLVDAYIEQGQAFFEEVNRLYGIGAALDPAGVRFAIVLILIVAVLSYEPAVRNSKKVIAQLLFCYFVIVVIGNMISRTTSVGLMLSTALAILGTQAISLTIKNKFFKVYTIFGVFLLVAIVVSAYLYNVDKGFHDDLRYGFEGFFNWMETGTWSTSSTDKLNSQMWIWPTDTKTWIIGSGLFDGFIYSTDIGYCRFILYCGLVGFTAFALLQIYNGLYFASREKEYRLLFFFLIASSFIIWIKVATDIFQFYALFYCLDSIKSSFQHENHLQHRSHT